MELILRYLELLELCRSELYDPFLADIEERCLEEIGILLRYNHNHDPHTGRFTSCNGVDNGGDNSIISVEKANGEAEIKTLGKLSNIQQIEKEFGKLNTAETIVTSERMNHIKEHHPQDLDLFKKYGVVAIENPNIILSDSKNINTIFMIKQFSDINMNVVIKLALQEDGGNKKNSVITFYRIRNRNVKKLAEKNKVLYKKE